MCRHLQPVPADLGTIAQVILLPDPKRLRIEAQPVTTCNVHFDIAGAIRAFLQANCETGIRDK